MRAICCAILSLVSFYMALHTNPEYPWWQALLVLLSYLLLAIAIVLMILGM